MKSFKIFLLFSVLLSSITNCASQKIEKIPPIQISYIYKQHWHSGQKAGGSGTNIFIELESELPENITLDSIYFETFRLALKQDSHNPLQLVGRRVVDSKKDYTIPVLNPVEKLETSNTTLNSSKFELEKNECVLRYTSSGTIKYYKYDSLYTKQTPLIP
ncbi:conserved hypothetical protein [Formosa agariphila KMM 3901]|uniref:Lipoprotein n=1 Tax=Formosa agariphila (strain DSM 15362 / KCTC 12365 / LMG 23005 / KMM 3901 / M-2Alg 35-1) TaxID=1347342 RepID=T2KSC7_FORAG|nr:hypothetical protein [Formosa agariphila]CDF81189.1 conserved hypothetical protein [Formosa agariphila KMM 3901]